MLVAQVASLCCVKNVVSPKKGLSAGMMHYVAVMVASVLCLQLASRRVGHVSGSDGNVVMIVMIEMFRVCSWRQGWWAVSVAAMVNSKWLPFHSGNRRGKVALRTYTSM